MSNKVLSSVQAELLARRFEGVANAVRKLSQHSKEYENTTFGSAVFVVAQRADHVRQMIAELQKDFDLATGKQTN